MLEVAERETGEFEWAVAVLLPLWDLWMVDLPDATMVTGTLG